MINIQTEIPLVYDGFRGFCHNNIVFIHIKDTAKILDLIYMNGYDEKGNPRLYTDWIRLHERYVCAKDFILRNHIIDPLYPEDYVPTNKKGPKSKHATKLPTYVHELIFLEMAKMGNYNSAKGSGVVDRFTFVKSVIKEFRKMGNEKVANRDLPLYERGKSNMSKNIGIIRTWNNSKTGLEYKVIYLNNTIFIERKAAAIQLGLVSVRTNRNNKTFIRWDSMRKYYKMAICELGMSENESGHTITVGEYQPNCGVNEKEIPEYIHQAIIISMANILNNEVAKQFRRDITSIIVPYFQQHAANDEICKVDFLAGMQAATNWKMREDLRGIPYEYNNYIYKTMVAMFDYVCNIRIWPDEYLLEELMKEVSDFDENKRRYLQAVIDNRLQVMMATGQRDMSSVTYRDYLGIFSIHLYELTGKIFYVLNQFIRESETTRRNINNEDQSQKYNKDGKPLKTVVEFVCDNPFTEQREELARIKRKNNEKEQ